MIKNKLITIIPDVHGRTFWKDAVQDIDVTPAIFLGDYIDPYSQEGIPNGVALGRFREILELKRSHPDRATLLLGNHDLHYLFPGIGGGRMDHDNHIIICDLIQDNLDLFDMALEMEAGERRYLFTHAGVLKGWLDRNDNLRYGDAPASVGARMNYLLHDETWRETLLWALTDTGTHRGGLDPFGSPVWADVEEHDPTRHELEGVYQVFGHTWMKKAIVTPYWACLDCGTAFVIDLESGTIRPKEN